MKQTYRKSKLAAASLAISVGTVLLLTSCASGSKSAQAELQTQDRLLLAQKLDPQVALANNTFGLELARRAIEEKPGENIIVSPASVTQALSMALNGASGATRDTMARTMRLDGIPLEKVNQAGTVMRELLGKSSPGVRMSIANSLWLQKDWPFRQTYLDSVRTAYGAKVEQANLTDAKVRKDINQWVKKETGGRIPSIVDGPVDPAVKAMLINALYMNAEWKTPFEKSATRDQDFTLANGSVKQVPMMHRTGQMDYTEEDAFQAVRLPYGDGQLSMLVVLPKPTADRKALAAKLFADPASWTAGLKVARGQLAMPRFRVEMTAELTKTLSAMGMGDAFDPKKADFSAMADTANGQLHISKVLHKTYLDVTEKGTEAAAATMIEATATSAPAGGLFEMKVDRPFWLAITDDQSGTLLFVGSVEQP